MKTISRGAVALAGTITLSLALVGCGSSDDGDDASAKKAQDAAEAYAKETPTKIVEDAVAAMKGLNSVRFKGSVPGDSGQTELDLAVDSDGNCSGTVGAEGGTAQIIVADGQQFLKGDEAYWIASLDETRGPTMSNLVGDRWVQLPESAQSFDSFCNLDSFLGEFEVEDAPETKGDLDEIDGLSVISLTEEEDGGTTTTWIATDDPHYVVRIENDGDEAGQIDFSDFDEPVDAEAPPADEIADLNGLGG